MSRGQFIATLVIVLVSVFFLMLVIIHTVTDPAKQVQRGYDEARTACAAGQAHTPQQERLCRIIR